MMYATLKSKTVNRRRFLGLYIATEKLEIDTPFGVVEHFSTDYPIWGTSERTVYPKDVASVLRDLDYIDFEMLGFIAARDGQVNFMGNLLVGDPYSITERAMRYVEEYRDIQLAVTNVIMTERQKKIAELEYRLYRN